MNPFLADSGLSGSSDSEQPPAEGRSLTVPSTPLRPTAALSSSADRIQGVASTQKPLSYSASAPGGFSRPRGPLQQTPKTPLKKRSTKFVIPSGRTPFRLPGSEPVARSGHAQKHVPDSPSFTAPRCEGGKRRREAPLSPVTTGAFAADEDLFCTTSSPMQQLQRSFQLSISPQLEEAIHCAVLRQSQVLSDSSDETGDASLAVAEALTPWRSRQMHRLLAGCFSCDGRAFLAAQCPLHSKAEAVEAVEAAEAAEAAGDFFEESFEIIDLLGHGSFADVYKVVHRRDGCLYAMKKTRQPFAGSADRDRRLQEVRTWLQLSGVHPNVATLCGAWEQAGFLFMQMPLYESGTLADLIPTISSEIWTVAEQIAGALEAMHGCGVVHSDLKPENIFLGDDGFLRVGDFGLSRLQARPSEFAGGDPEEGDKIYLAPEVLDGVVAPASDVFSFGLILLEIASGRPLPSQGAAWQQLRSGDLSGCAQFTRVGDARIGALVRGMLAPDHRERATIGQVVALVARCVP